MSETRADTADTDRAAAEDAIGDTRKVWITPTIEELPINESRGTVTGTGSDTGGYS